MNTSQLTTLASELRETAPDVAVGINEPLEAAVQGYTAADEQFAELMEWTMSAATASERAVRVLATAKMLDRAAALR